MLNPLLQLIRINLKDIRHIANASGRKSFLVDVNVTVVGAAVRSIDVKVH
jgi:hypothetical protein